MAKKNPLLIVLSGLPGTGKTTIARQVADQLGATYLRIDTIEQALRSALGLMDDVGPAGYVVAYAISETNLASGRTVVADCVNPIAATREAWRLVAANTHSPIVEVELFCSDAVEHRRRIEARTIDIAGLARLTWEKVLARDYEVWPVPTLRIDTALVDPTASVRLIVEEAMRRQAAEKAGTSD
ncbi:MAG: AAA family ATPase [Sphingomicrobium sp.]